MNDQNTRELVLSRLLTLGEAWKLNPPAMVPAALKSAARNQLIVGETDCPSLSLLDGDEDDNDDDPVYRPGKAARRVVMRPQAVFCVAAPAAVAGSHLNAYRKAWWETVRADAELAGIVGANGFIRYRGCNTDYGIGRQLAGTMLVNIAFGYMV